MSDRYRNNASAIPGTMCPRGAKSLHSEPFLPGGMLLCVMLGRHCQSFDSTRGLTVALDSSDPVFVLLLAPIASKTDGRCHATSSGVSRVELKAEKTTG